MRTIVTKEVEYLGMTVKMHVEISGGDPAGSLSGDAQDRIAMVARTETQRIAEIAAVDMKDQDAAKDEAQRIASAPKDRSFVTVGAGTKNAEAVTVHRGEVQVAGRKMAAKKGGQ